VIRTLVQPESVNRTARPCLPPRDYARRKSRKAARRSSFAATGDLPHVAPNQLGDIRES